LTVAAARPAAPEVMPAAPWHAIIRAVATAAVHPPEPSFTPMSIVIRDVREHELDSVLALNNNACSAILPLAAAKLRDLYGNAEYFRVAERDGNLAGFLVGFGSDSGHDSCNFAWFKQRYPHFFYIDRIVVASRRRGGGVGRAFYADVQSYAELRYPLLCSEVFLDHGADPALLFHGSFGFHEVGQHVMPDVEV